MILISFGWACDKSGSKIGKDFDMARERNFCGLCGSTKNKHYSSCSILIQLLCTLYSHALNKYVHNQPVFLISTIGTQTLFLIYITLFCVRNTIFPSLEKQGFSYQMICSGKS